MTKARFKLRTMVVGAVAVLAVTLGAGACGSSSKTNVPASGSNSPAPTTPATTVPTSGGVSY